MSFAPLPRGLALALLALAACAEGLGTQGGFDDPAGDGGGAADDASAPLDGRAAPGDGAGPSPQADGASGSPDAAGDGSGPGSSDAGTDAGLAADVGPGVDAGSDAARPDGSVSGGIVTGGPCSSGAVGGTAFRVRWVNSGGRAQVSYDVNGLPDRSRWKVGYFDRSTSPNPQWGDPYLGEGGLDLGSQGFVDIELSTAGISVVRSATLAFYGRSYDTGASGSFSWQTRTGGGDTTPNSVSNATPYRWYAVDVTASGAIGAGDGGMLLRFKAGPGSSHLVVNRLELCVDAL